VPGEIDPASIDRRPPAHSIDQLRQERDIIDALRLCAAIARGETCAGAAVPGLRIPNEALGLGLVDRRAARKHDDEALAFGECVPARRLEDIARRAAGAVEHHDKRPAFRRRVA